MRKWAVFCIAGMLMAVMTGCIQTAKTDADSLLYVEEIIEEPKPPENRLEEVQAAGILTIAVSADYAPFAFMDEEDRYVGADIEFGKYIAESLGVAARFVELEFGECMNAVSEGSVDMALLGMLPEAERQEMMDFTDVYYEPGRQILLSRKNDENDYKTLEDFAGKTISAQYGSLQAQLVVEQLPQSYLEYSGNVEHAVGMLRTENVDGVVLDEEMAEALLQQYSSLAFTGIELYYESQGIVGGVVKEEPELLQAVNDTIKQVVEEKLYFQWLDSANELAASIPENK